MSQTANNAWHGLPRAEIRRHPTVVADRCIGCGLCATSCGRGVYAFDYNCMFGPARGKASPPHA